MDASWYKAINRFAVHTPWLHGFMKVYAVDGVALFALLVIAAWWSARSASNASRAVAAAVWAAAATLIAVGINQIIVKAVARPRPYLTLHGVEVLVSRSTDYSFPSDHAITAGAATAGLWIVARYSGRPARWLAGVGTALALLLAFARVYVGAHYPGDVTAGLVIGAAISVFGWFVVQRVLTLAVERIARNGRLRIFVHQAKTPTATPDPASSLRSKTDGAPPLRMRSADRQAGR